MFFFSKKIKLAHERFNESRRDLHPVVSFTNLKKGLFSKRELGEGRFGRGAFKVDVQPCDVRDIVPTWTLFSGFNLIVYSIKAKQLPKQLDSTHQWTNVQLSSIDS